MLIEVIESVYVVSLSYTAIIDELLHLNYPVVKLIDL